VSQSLPSLERPAFFAGQRLTAEDLAAAQSYTRELRWLHNRSLHGWGIVLGLAVSGTREEREVKVSPGFALDCAGRELVLEAAKTLRVPPVADGTFDLTISFAEDAALEQVTRHGACRTEGATRILDDAALRWISTDDVLEVGLDVVLARVSVADCAVDELSLGGRDELDRGGPHVAAGQTAPGETPWRLWPSESDPLGLATTVSTAEGGFATTPVYQARLAGSRNYRGDTIVDGHPVLNSAGPDSFEFGMLLPKGDSLVSSGLPFNDLDFDTLRDVARDELHWHVVWLGIEA
jgi:hypothetical protein